MKRREFLQATTGMAALSLLPSVEASTSTPKVADYKSKYPLPLIPTPEFTGWALRQNQKQWHHGPNLDNGQPRSDARIAWEDKLEEFVEDAWKTMVAHEFVGIIPMPGPKLAYIPTNREEPPSELTPGTKLNKLNLNGITLGKDTYDSILWEYQLLINREIVSDLRNNARITNWDFEQSKGQTIREKCKSLVELIDASDSNWLITSPEIGSLLAAIQPEYQPVTSDYTEGCYFPGLGCRCDANCKGRKIFIDALYPTGEILLGRRNDHEVGYYYCPYLCATPSLGGHISRYGKRLTDSRYYHRIKVKNFII